MILCAIPGLARYQTNSLITKLTMVIFKINAGPVFRLLLVLFISTSLAAQAQRTDDGSHYRAAPVPANLLPIERAAGSSSLGSVYFYGGKKLSSPYSLEIPFYELNDPTVNHHFRTFRTLTTFTRLTSVATLVYALLNRKGNNDTYWVVYGSSVAASLTFTIVGNGQVNKAVNRYNELLRQPRVGLSVSPVPLTGQVAFGAGVAWRF